MNLSTPILWVIFPLAMAALIGVLYKRKLLGIILTSATAFGLAALAAFFPETGNISISSWEIDFIESLSFFGRSITTAFNMLPFIAMIYAATGLWAIISRLPGTPAAFRPISLAITAILTAAMGVEPFLYAALMIQAAVMTSIPILLPFGEVANKGLLRFLILETSALPLILIAGWMLSGVETLPPDSALVGQTAVILGLGFSLWLGVFPFHSWVPMLGEKVRPIVFTFLMFILPTTILVFSLNFFDRYTFLRTLPNLDQILKTFGTLMILFGGLLTAFQDDLRRAFSFSTLTETGFSLLAIGYASQGGLAWMLLLFPVRALGYWLWGYCLTAIDNHTGALDIQKIQSAARQYPILSAGLLLSQLSIAGLPLLASFPIKLIIFRSALTSNTTFAVWSFLGNIGLFVFTIRLLAALVSPEDNAHPQNWLLSEKPFEILMVVGTTLVLIVLGLFHHKLLPGIVETLTAFTPVSYTHLRAHET